MNQPDTIPADAVTPADYERLALARLDRAVAAYLFGAAGDGVSAAENRAAFDRLRLWPRPLAPVGGGHTRLTLFGREYAHPVFLAPVAYQTLAHPEGECATARAAEAMDACLCLSGFSSQTWESIRAAAPQARLWCQLYLRPDFKDTVALIRRAEAVGAEAIVVTVDAPVEGLRFAQARAGFRLPPGVRAVMLDGHRPPPANNPGEGSVVFDAIMPAAPGWADLRRVRDVTRLPLVIKGILHPDDADAALDCGADGLVVSNHGGRVLDGTPAAIHALPGVVARAAGRAPVLLDGGVRRGGDVFKALALGASAVMCGRIQPAGLAVAGALGVAHSLRLLREELEITMALAGRRTLPDITCDALAGS